MIKFSLTFRTVISSWNSEETEITGIDFKEINYRKENKNPVLHYFNSKNKKEIYKNKNKFYNNKSEKNVI